MGCEFNSQGGNFYCWILFVLRKKASDVNIAKFVYFEKAPNGNLFPKRLTLRFEHFFGSLKRHTIAITNTECHGFIFSQNILIFFLIV